MDLGFIGLGVMGQPMALNLARAGTSIIVWNRSPDKCEMLRAAGARVAAAPKELFKQARFLRVVHQILFPKKKKGFRLEHRKPLMLYDTNGCGGLQPSEFACPAFSRSNGAYRQLLLRSVNIVLPLST